MTTLGLYAEHICEVCRLPVSNHPEMAADGNRYFPPLCCDGCPCGQTLSGPPAATEHVESTTAGG
jgi:hypothetical protein